MIGAGIFALLGEAASIAGSAVWASFLLGGAIALLSGYSFGKLGARYPSAGGVVEYLVQGFGVGRFSGAMSVMMYISALVSISLVARTFGAYAFALMPDGWPSWLVEGCAAAIILVFMFVNLDGAQSMARLENVVVLVKMCVLAGFIIIGMAFISPERLSPARYPPASAILYSVAVTFFAYEGFRIITNAAEDMPEPGRTLPRAIMTAILLVMVVYVGIAISVLGTLSPAQVIEAKHFALAEAARPVLGQAGFTTVAVTALFATASAINASLYAVTNITYRLAKLGELPAPFLRPIRHSREGLVVSSVMIIALAVFFDLSQIAAIGALSMLLLHATVHLGHLRLLKETDARPGLVFSATVASGVAFCAGSYHLARMSPRLLVWIGSFVFIAFVIEFALHWITARSVTPRVDGDEGPPAANPSPD